MAMNAQQLMQMMTMMGASGGDMHDAMAKAEVLTAAMKRGDLAGGLQQLGVDPKVAAEMLGRAETMAKHARSGDLEGALRAMGLSPEQIKYAMDAAGAARAGKDRAAKLKILSDKGVPDSVANTILLLGPAKGNA